MSDPCPKCESQSAAYAQGWAWFCVQCSILFDGDGRIIADDGTIEEKEQA